MVAELAQCQQKLGEKYLSAFPTTWWDRLAKGERVWAPFYTIHIIMAGMFDMYRLANNQQALQVLEGMAAWADEWTAPKTEEHMQRTSFSTRPYFTTKSFLARIAASGPASENTPRPCSRRNMSVRSPFVPRGTFSSIIRLTGPSRRVHYPASARISIQRSAGNTGCLRAIMMIRQTGSLLTLTPDRRSTLSNRVRMLLISL